PRTVGSGAAGAAPDATGTVTLCWLNCRGASNRAASIIRYIRSVPALIAALSETHLCGQDIGTHDYRWVAGKENLPPGDSHRPPAGMGMLIASSSSAIVHQQATHTMWARFTSRNVTVFMGSVFILRPRPAR